MTWHPALRFELPPHLAFPRQVPHIAVGSNAAGHAQLMVMRAYADADAMGSSDPFVRAAYQRSDSTRR